MTAANIKTILGICLFTLLSFGIRAEEPRGAPVSLNIEAQPLGNALNEFGQQSGLQVVFFYTDINPKLTSPRLSGKYSPEVALSQLLANTPLSYKFINARTVAIVAKPEEAQANKQSAMSPARDLTQMAQNGTNEPQRPARAAAAGGAGGAQSDDGKAERDDARQMVVTGTHIRGAESAGSKLIVIDREQIENSGFARIPDILDKLPQNFGGGASRDNLTMPNSNNWLRGTALNLRGLGPSATLVLVDGRRRAPGGTYGAFVDVTNIPSSAVERIEIMTDGASALYGSDAVGGVVNFILRKDYRGAESQAHFGSADGAAKEVQLSQLFGTDWSSGRAMLAYQFYRQDPFYLSDHPYLRSNGDQRRFGGSDFSRAFSLYGRPGNIIDPNTFEVAYAIPHGQDGTALTPADLLAGVVNPWDPTGDGAEYHYGSQLHTALLSVSQRIGERWEVFFEGLYGGRDIRGGRANGFAAFLTVPSSNPFFVDPFGGSDFVYVGRDMIDDIGPLTATGSTDAYAATLGSTVQLGSQWGLSLTGSYNEESNRFALLNFLDFGVVDALLADPDPATAYNPFSDGANTNPATLEALRASQVERGISKVRSFNAIADGPLFNLPGGAAKLAVGADYREEDQSSGRVGTPASDVYILRGMNTSRRISALFAELSVPLVGASNARTGIRRLSASVAGRYEEYSDFGATFNPKIGLSWSPVDALKLRGTWGTSFRAPNMLDLIEAGGLTAVGTRLYQDPKGNGGFSRVLLLTGNNAGLHEEKSEMWTAGFDFAPAALPGMVLSATYFDINYTGKIAFGSPPDGISVLVLEDQWKEVITRNPPQSLIDFLCSGQRYPVLDSCTPTPTVFVDARLRNIARVNVTGLDLDLSQTINTGAHGVVTFGIGGSYMFDYLRALSAASPQFQVVNTVGNPLSLRLRGHASWAMAGWSAHAVVNHAGGYKDPANNRGVDASMTLDLGIGYRLDVKNKWLSGTQIALNAVNVFNTRAPFVDTSYGYDTANSEILRRVVSLSMTKSW